MALSYMCVDAAPGVAERPGGYWTPLLGLKMAPCEEELSLIVALWKNTIGRLLDLFAGNRVATTAHCESQETHCPGTAALTGLEVRFGRDEKHDRDQYDFKMRCGPSWRSWMGLKYPSAPDEQRSDAIRCSSGMQASGVQERSAWTRKARLDFIPSSRAFAQRRLLPVLLPTRARVLPALGDTWPQRGNGLGLLSLQAEVRPWRISGLDRGCRPAIRQPILSRDSISHVQARPRRYRHARVPRFSGLG